MKRIIILLCCAILLFPMAIDYSDGEEICYLRISHVYPIGDEEGFALTNYGVQEIDLRSFSVTDNEGSVFFESSIIISSNETVFFFKNSKAFWIDGERTYIYGENGVINKKMALNDNGDDLHLKHGDTVIDTFVYGNIEFNDPGWKGDIFNKIPRGAYAKRTSFFDTDSSADWTLIDPLRTAPAEQRTFNADVSPFTFPECKGDVIFSELSSANESVLISIYLINHPDIFSVLKGSLQKGVSVKILVDGSPAGGIGKSELGYLSALIDCGAEVHLIKNIDNGKRFAYLHNKYAVIDGQDVIITSENWQQSSFENNIGWGAVIRSAEFSEYMSKLFFSDFSGADIISFKDLYPKTESYTIYPSYPDIVELEWFEAEISPVISPDFSFESVGKMIESAGSFIYIQQLDIDSNWLGYSENPLKWTVERANEIECRVMIDVTFDDPNDDDLNDGYRIKEELSDQLVDIRLNGRLGLLHNKGVITDDSVLLGSLNWTQNSFTQNREVSVIILSVQISEFYKLHYLKYWDMIAPYSGEIIIDCPRMMFSSDTILLDASASDVDSKTVFSWDTDGDGKPDRFGPKVPLNLKQGEHRITLFTELDGVYNQKTIDILCINEVKKIEFPWMYLPLLIVGTLLIYKSLYGQKGRCRNNQMYEKR